MRAPTCEGLVKWSEGEQLARLAGLVPRSHAIVEIGSHTGLSTVWMARNARAHVFAVDPWQDPRPASLDDPFELGAGDNVLARFRANMADQRVVDRVTPIRARSLELARHWVQPVGLLFIDAVHEYDAVRDDYLAWSPFIPAGGWLAFHDYTIDVEHPYHGVAQAIEAHVPRSQWSEPTVTEYLWSAQRLPY